MVDIASLGMKIDSTQADQAAKSLDGMAAAGGRAETATSKLGKAGAATAAEISAYQAKVIAATVAQTGMTEAAARAALGFGAIEKAAGPTSVALQAAAGSAHGYTSAMGGATIATSTVTREILVLGREFARGNFSRMAGSATILAQALGLLPLLLNPIVLGLAAVAGGLIAAGVAGVQYATVMQKISDISSGVGRNVGLTADALTDAAQQGAAAAGVAIGTANEQALAYAKTGQIGASIIQGLTGLTEAYARATGEKAAQAVKDLGAAFADPARGAEDLDRKLSLLTDTELHHIQVLAESGDKLQAQGALLDALNSHLDTTKDHVGGLAGAWDVVARSASGAWTAIGAAVDRLASMPQRALDALKAMGNLNLGGGGLPGAPIGFGPSPASVASGDVALQANEAARNTASRIAGDTARSLVPDASVLENLKIKQAQLYKDIQSGADTAAGHVALVKDAYQRVTDAIGRVTDATGAYIPQATREHQIAVLQAQASATHDKALKGVLATRIALLKVGAQAITNAEAERKANDAGALAVARTHTKATPTDQTDQLTAEVDRRVAQAAQAELQARLGVTKDVTARAGIEKQIAEAQSKVQAAELDGLTARIDAAVKAHHISDVTGDQLKNDLETAYWSAIASDLAKQQVADQKKAADLAKQTFDAQIDQQQRAVDLLTSQRDLAELATQRLPIDRAILEAQQAIARSKVEEQLAAATALNDQVAIAKAQADLANLLKGQANQTKAVVGGLLDNFDKASGAVGSMADAFSSHDWVGVLRGLDQAIANIQTAFGPGGTLGSKIGAVAGVANQVGHAIGGTVGSGISGAASGAAAGAGVGLFLGGPAGAAIGAVVGGIGGFISGIFGGEAKARAAEKAREQAEAERVAQVHAQAQSLENQLLEATGNHLQAVANQRRDEIAQLDATNQALAQQEFAAEDAAAIASKRADLEIALMTAQGNALGVLNAQRKAEIAALQPELQWLQQTVYLAQDQATAAAKAVADLTTANDNAQQVLDTAKQGLQDAYNTAASALQNTISGFTGLADALQQVLDALDTGPQTALGAAAQFAAARGQFRSTAALAAGGDQTAGGNLSSVAQTFLDAAKATAPNLQAYARDVAEVRNAVTVAKAAAITQVDAAQQQLSVLNAQVSGLLTINGSVLSVKDAIDALAFAQATANTASGALTAAQAAAQPPAAAPVPAAKQALLSGDAAAAARYLAANADLDARYNHPTGNVGDFNPVAGESEIQFALRHYLVKGQYEPRALFGLGGVFTKPTDFNIGRMAEAGPEAIMPLAQMPGGGLGVRAANDDSLVQAVRDLRDEVRQLRSEQRAGHIAIAKNTGVVARAQKRNDGQGQAVRAADPSQPIEVRVVA